MPYDLTDPAGIAANQRGELTDEQRQRATRAARGQRGCLYSLLHRAVFPLVGLALVIVLVITRAPVLLLWIVTLITLVIGVELLMLTVLPFFQQQQLLRHDLLEEHLESAEGRLVYRQRSYEAVSGERVLLLPRTAASLRPDTLYRFYFLPRSGYVLSAEALGLIATVDARAALLEALAVTLNFDMDTLAANRRGQLTPAQSLRLLPQLLAARGDFTRGQLWADLMQGRVETTEGIGRRLTLLPPSRPYAYQVGARRFSVPEKALNVFMDDFPYRVYHTPRSGILVSLEPLAMRREPSSPADVAREGHENG